MVLSALTHRAAKPIAHLLCALPLAWLIGAAATQGLGANPAEALIRSLGDWALRGLLLTLAITPLRVQFHQPALLRFRRLLGVWTFAYASLHLLAYAWLDMGLGFSDIARDIAKRPFILVGMLSFALLLPLAATSFNRAVRWLGGKRWQALHRLIYLIPFSVCLHFWWMRAGKNNFSDPFFYSALFALALGWRLWRRWQRQAA
ncbi:sulfoxide reductase heme-binding subunit YedZ [Inhella inkyongensis]|uniref:Protein-methionine-sulfoxide reductase heme-binding subunit MsrQ n=1 Tax=Inhella inkyongensis TaxID=392593 RepID=A0A840S404_9BURK|nr:protein-methionine-sulfoxide reductase heme-binding subunit MsrQ [Inhella inkyongensis]MBB5203249.1 sulfoxide reductase heme-binding subunit YedZ [Inhella inkyongensis]